MGKYPKRIIILGASGFIGKNIYNKFLENKNIKVEGFSSKDCNLLSLDEVRKKLRGLCRNDALIFAAAIKRSLENSVDSMIKNIRMAENIVTLIREHPVGHCIFLSSVDVYGINFKKNKKISEKLKIEPNDYFSVSQASSELLLKIVCSELRVPLTILRLPGIYGPGDNAWSTVGVLTKSIFDKRKIYIYGDGKNMRDYVYVEDIYKIICLILQKKIEGTLNIATGKSYSILQIADTIRQLLPCDFKVEYLPCRKVDKTRLRRMVFDCSLLKSRIPGLKMTSLKEGIVKYINYYTSRRLV